MSSTVPEFLERLRSQSVPARLWGCQYGRQAVFVRENDDIESAASAYNMAPLQTKEEFHVETADLPELEGSTASVFPRG